MIDQTTIEQPRFVFDSHSDVAAMLNRLTGRLIDLLRNEGIDDPLGEPLTLACVLADLYTVAQVPAPALIAVRLEDSTDCGEAAPQ